MARSGAVRRRHRRRHLLLRERILGEDHAINRLVDNSIDLVVDQAKVGIL